MKVFEGVEDMALKRFKKSHCLLVVIRVTVFNAKTICPTRGEYAMCVLVAIDVPSETKTSREARQLLEQAQMLRIETCDGYDNIMN